MRAPATTEVVNGCDRVHLYLTPGFNVHLLPGVTFRTGLQLPVSGARQFDCTLHSALVWEF